MRNKSFGKVIFTIIMVLCMAVPLTAGIAQAQCVSDDNCTNGRCRDGYCLAVCEDDADCNNGLFCDGVETCDLSELSNPSRGLCKPGTIPCGADFCDEDAAPGYQCVECDRNADCFGGVCRQSDNVCVECKNDSHCDNGRFCDGQETCDNNVCVLGNIPCAGQFCNETGGGTGTCLTCDEDADCHGLGTCVTNECVECEDDSACDNGEYCDGLETCNAGVCVSGSLPCPGDFCNETDNECLECEDDADCFGGLCENNICVECRQRSDCGNGLWCDGRETCNAGICEPGNIRCAGEFCDEDANTCLECTADADCSIGAAVDGLCNNTLCVECLVDTDCNDGNFCNGEEICNILSGTCESLPVPCADQFCNETSDDCQACNVDANCGVNGMCIDKECVECEVNSDCSNGLWCDGWERCNEGICEAGRPRCSGEFCNEDTNACLDCIGDDNCTGVCDEDNICVDCLVDDDCERGFCSNKTCVECRNSSDCDNGLWCDGAETCNETTNLCEPVGGDIPCASQFCDEGANNCLTCLDDDDCFGGVCDGDNLCAECLDDDDCEGAEVCSGDNICVECTRNGHCDNDLHCDGVETCDRDAGVCLPGAIPCPGDFCNETGDSCLECEEDADCHIGGDGTGRCYQGVCMDCFGSEDCDNGLFCDGAEICEAGICQDGIPECDGNFCDEDADECLTCTVDEDCLGLGKCLDNECVECTEDTDCDNALICDGTETCVDNECVLGPIPCPGVYCDEDDGCQTCIEDADCCRGEDPDCEGGRCINNYCFDCFGNDDCDNGLFCDGIETCNAGFCELGTIPCSGDFCNEADESCLTCIGDEDCFGGVCLDDVCVECTEDGDCSDGFCVDNICVECVEDATCDNGQFCDGVETCEANVCIEGTAPCMGETCDETEDLCLSCVEDSDCGEFASCVNTECVAYPIASPLTEVTLKGPGLAEVIFYPNQLDIASIKLSKTTEKSSLTIITRTSKLKKFNLFVDAIDVEGTMKAITGKHVVLTGPVTAGEGIAKIQVAGAEPGSSIQARWIGNLTSSGHFAGDLLLTGDGFGPKDLTLGKANIKGELRNALWLVNGDVGTVAVGLWGAGSILAVGVDAGLNTSFFDADDVITGGQIKKLKFKYYEPGNGGLPFGIIAEKILKNKTPLPFTDEDFRMRQLQ